MAIGLPDTSDSRPRKTPVVGSKTLIVPLLLRLVALPKLPTSRSLLAGPKFGGAMAKPQGPFSLPFGPPVGSMTTRLDEIPARVVLVDEATRPPDGPIG